MYFMPETFVLILHLVTSISQFFDTTSHHQQQQWLYTNSRSLKTKLNHHFSLLNTHLGKLFVVVVVVEANHFLDQFLPVNYEWVEWQFDIELEQWELSWFSWHFYCRVLAVCLYMFVWVRLQLTSVWPEKNRLKSIKVVQKWFHCKNEWFWHLYKNCLTMWVIWAN